MITLFIPGLFEHWNTAKAVISNKHNLDYNIHFEMQNIKYNCFMNTLKFYIYH